MLDVMIIGFLRSDGVDCSGGGGGSGGGDGMLITDVCCKYCSTNSHRSDISC